MERKISIYSDVFHYYFLNGKKCMEERITFFEIKRMFSLFCCFSFFLFVISYLQVQVLQEKFLENRLNIHNILLYEVSLISHSCSIISPETKITIKKCTN